MCTSPTARELKWCQSKRGPTPDCLGNTVNRNEPNEPESVFNVDLVTSQETRAHAVRVFVCVSEPYLLKW